MRLVFYLLGGIISALIGWNLSLVILDLFKFASKTITGSTFPFYVEFILFPIVTICLSVTLVLTTIYLSNPIHYKANRRIRNSYLKIALKTGLIAGAIAAVLTVIIYQGKFPPASVRIVGWSLIGLGAGVAEGLSWRSLSTEGAKSNTFERPIKSALFGLLAGLIAALAIEFLRTIIPLGGYEDLLGFTLFGAGLGMALAISTTPTYQVALRAGRGFGRARKDNQSGNYPKINDRSLRIVNFEQTQIEEGLSIQLPRDTSQSLQIGSAEDADIFLPDVPAIAAKLSLERKQWRLSTPVGNKVQIQRRMLSENATETLYHNQMLTFYHENTNTRYYRFIFCDRFLDPDN
jgi:hypothetical protein